MRIYKAFAKDTLVYGLGKGLKKFVTFLILPFYTRALTPSDYGILESLGTFTYFIMAFLNLGLDTASWFYFFQPKNEEERGKILFTTFVFRLITVIPAIIVSYFSREISIYLFNTDAYTSSVFIACMVIPVNMLTSEQEHIYRFDRKPWRYSMLTIIKTAGNLLLGILLVVNLKWGVYGAQIASIVSGLMVILFSFIFYTRKRYTYKFSFYWAKKLLKYGYPLAIAGLAVWIYAASDRIFLLKFQNALQVGYYSIGNTFSNPLGLLTMAVQMSAGILFFEIYHKEEDESKKESKKAVADMVKLFTLPALIITAFLSVFAYNIVEIVTTKDYLPGITVIPILLFTMIITQIKEMIGVGISLSEKTFYFTIIVFVSAGVNVLLNVFLIPAYSFFGASISNMLTSIVSLIYIYVISQRYFRVDYQVFQTILLLGLSFTITLFIPIMEINYNVSINLIYKILIFMFLCSVPFLLGYVDYRTVRAEIVRVLNNRKRS